MAQIVNLNDSSPAAPSGALNVKWQKGPSSGTDPATGVPIYPASASVAVMGGDSGSGGTMGLVPAPAAGDAAAGKVLKADGTWYIPPGSNPMTDVGDLIIGGTVSGGVATPTRLAAGAAGKVLTSNGASTAPSWQAPGGGGGLALLGSQTASNSAELDFTSVITSSYDEYVLEFLALVPVTNGVDLLLQCSTNNGAPYDTAANYSTHGLVYGAGVGTDAQQGITGMPLDYTPAHVDNAAAWGLKGTVRLYLVQGPSDYLRITGQSYYMTQGVRCGFQIQAAYEVAGAAVNAFRVIASSGNLASGTVRVYGLPK